MEYREGFRFIPAKLDFSILLGDCHVQGPSHWSTKGTFRRFSDHPMELIDNVVAELKAVGEKHGGKLPSQVALNWIIAKGAIPIPGAKNRQQAQENAGALGWSLDGDDLERLDSAALGGVRSFQSRIWQHG